MYFVLSFSVMFDLIEFIGDFLTCFCILNYFVVLVEFEQTQQHRQKMVQFSPDL